MTAAWGPNAGVFDSTNTLGTGIGGFNDWYIPAKDEIDIIRNSGSASALGWTVSAAVTYWSSTQVAMGPTSAYQISFVSASWGIAGKTSSVYGHAVRRAALSGSGSTQVLSIINATGDGFAVGQKIKGVGSGATGVITAIDGSSITVTQTSGTAFTVGEKVQGDGTQIVPPPANPNTSNLTTLPLAGLSSATPFYARVRYTSGTIPTTSDWSGWSKFTTA
jgi:hypothetical protein